MNSTPSRTKRLMNNIVASFFVKRMVISRCLAYGAINSVLSW